MVTFKSGETPQFQNFPYLTTEGSTLSTKNTPAVHELDDDPMLDDEDFEDDDWDDDDDEDKESLDTIDFIHKDLDEVYEKYLSDSLDEYKAKLEAIIAFAKDHKDVFRTNDMYQDMLDIYQVTHELSEKQMDTIDKTVEKWNIYYW